MRTSTILLGLLVLSTSPALPQEPDLAARANRIEWKVPLGSSDLFPAALRELQRELEAGGPEALARIEPALESSENLRRIAPQVIARHPGDPARRMLTALIAQADWITAAEAAFSCGEVGGVELIEPLTTALGHESPHVRHNALNALGALGAADRAADPAIGLLDDPDPAVRDSAAALLQDLRGSTNAAKAKAALERRIGQTPDRRNTRELERTRAILWIRFPA